MLMKKTAKKKHASSNMGACWVSGKLSGWRLDKVWNKNALRVYNSAQKCLVNTIRFLYENKK